MRKKFQIITFYDWHNLIESPTKKRIKRSAIINKHAMNIRRLYAPIQPNVTLSADNLAYAELFPDVRLQNYIYCYWQFKTTTPFTDKFNHLIVADGCIDIFFELNNPNDSYVMGFSKEFTEFQLDYTFNYIGIRFLPTMFPQLFSVNAKELSNKFVHLDSVAPSTSHFIKNNLDDNQHIREIKNIFDQYFLNIISNTHFKIDNRLYQAIDIILKNQGIISVEKDLNTGISPRQLRRLFEFYIGDNAKTFSKVVRFQNILKSNPSSQSLRRNKLFYDAGYYDQAHFIKDFKNLYGVTPSKAFRE